MLSHILIRTHENAVNIYCLLLAYNLELSIIGAASQKGDNFKKRNLVNDYPLFLMTGRYRSPNLSKQDFVTVPIAPVHTLR
jgi:hypothetical protein